VANHALDIVMVFIWALLLSGCVDLKTDAGASRAAELRLQGVWSGLTVNDCSPVQVEPSRCRAVQRITFTMLRSNETSWGSYRCAPGTTPCYGGVDRGAIKYLRFTGRLLWFRVMRDDYSSCLFDTIPAANIMRGKFWCFQGDELVERGSWQVERAY
jgi:hypothetical protein